MPLRPERQKRKLCAQRTRNHKRCEQCEYWDHTDVHQHQIERDRDNDEPHESYLHASQEAEKNKPDDQRSPKYLFLKVHCSPLVDIVEGFVTTENLCRAVV